ncbi:MAG: zinc ribbon domain-containing protein [candidate division WOR-3 bacterium]
MPVYEYICSDCGERIEVLATIEEKEKGLRVICPKCGSEKVLQVFSSFAVGSSKGSSPTCGCQG